MADDLSSDSHAGRGIDLIAGRAGAFVRGNPAYTPQPQTATANFVTAGVECSGHSDIRLDSVVTALSGTAGPQATVTLQTSFDNGVTDAWRTVATLAAQTATGTLRAGLGTLDRWVRASVAVAGTTPSVTMTLSGELI